MVKLNENNTVFPGGRNYIKGTADITAYTTKEAIINGQSVQVKVYESRREEADRLSLEDFEVDADLISGIENTEN